MKLSQLLYKEELLKDIKTDKEISEITSRVDEITPNSLFVFLNSINFNIELIIKDVLNKKGTFLSGGQQQRLCIARALAMKPDILLMDEPTSALDPIATKHIEELLLELQKEVTILIVTHNMGQAMRISSKSMFMYLGELVEYDDTATMFSNPADERTKAYLTGKMG